MLLCIDLCTLSLKFHNWKRPQRVVKKDSIIESASDLSGSGMR